MTWTTVSKRIRADPMYMYEKQSKSSCVGDNPRYKDIEACRYECK